MVQFDRDHPRIGASAILPMPKWGSRPHLHRAFVVGRSPSRGQEEYLFKKRAQQAPLRAALTAHDVHALFGRSTCIAGARP